MPVDQHAGLRAPRVLRDEVRGPRREAPTLREAVVDAAGHRHVEDLDPQVRRVALRDPVASDASQTKPTQVSYFKAPKAHKGSDAPDAQTTYEGITYKFTNADVVAMFLEAPELFLPQYRAASTPSRESQKPLVTDATQVRRLLRVRGLEGQARDGGPGRLRRARREALPLL